jgi:hypothetical protein
MACHTTYSVICCGVLKSISTNLQSSLDLKWVDMLEQVACQRGKTYVSIAQTWRHKDTAVMNTSDHDLPPYKITSRKKAYKSNMFPFWPHQCYPHLIVVVGFECSWDSESYTGSSIATGRAIQAGQVEG